MKLALSGDRIDGEDLFVASDGDRVRKALPGEQAKAMLPIDAARAEGIPVATITETMVPASGTWQGWQTAMRFFWSVFCSSSQVTMRSSRLSNEEFAGIPE